MIVVVSKASEVDDDYTFGNLMQNLVVSILQPFSKLQIIDSIYCLFAFDKVVAQNVRERLLIDKESIETIGY